MATLRPMPESSTYVVWVDSNPSSRAQVFQRLVLDPPAVRPLFEAGFDGREGITEDEAVMFVREHAASATPDEPLFVVYLASVGATAWWMATIAAEFPDRVIVVAVEEQAARAISAWEMSDPGARFIPQDQSRRSIDAISKSTSASATRHEPGNRCGSRMVSMHPQRSTTCKCDAAGAPRLTHDHDRAQAA